jgi:hypothetical protein
MFSFLRVVKNNSGAHRASGVPEVLSPEVKRPRRKAGHSSTSAEVVDLYIHSHIRLHGVMLNELSTGTNLPSPFICLVGTYSTDYTIK